MSFKSLYSLTRYALRRCVVGLFLSYLYSTVDIDLKNTIYWTSFCVQNNFRIKEISLISASVELESVSQQGICSSGNQKIEFADPRHEHPRLAVKKVAHDSERSRLIQWPQVTIASEFSTKSKNPARLTSTSSTQKVINEGQSQANRKIN